MSVSNEQGQATSAGFCAARGEPAQGHFSIHRDGFGDGPEVGLCDACGAGPEPDLAELWRMIKSRAQNDQAHA